MPICLIRVIQGLYCDIADIAHVGIQDEDWIIGNQQQYGFYRITYEDDNWRALITQLKKQHEVCREMYKM